MPSTDSDYFRERAEEHRREASLARSNVAGLHLQLARNYDELAATAAVRPDRATPTGAAPISLESDGFQPRA